MKWAPPANQCFAGNPKVRQAAAVVLFILLLRLPFLNQAVQGDDVNYLGAAQYAQTDPAHPSHYEFVFQGKKVSMRGHPHPPLNAWTQAALLAWSGDISEVRFHCFYIVFSLIAGLSTLSLARRFTTKPLTTTLLACATPAFIVNGMSLESDLPFLAFWLASIALYVKAVDRRSWKILAAAGLAMPLAAMAAFQSLVMVPILLFYLWRNGKDWKPGWAALAVVPATLIAYQLFEKLTSDTLPAEVLAGYFSTYGLQTLTNKLRNAAALTTHAGWMILVPCPGSFLLAAAAVPFAIYLDPNPLFWLFFLLGLRLLLWCWRNRNDFLAAWVLVFFAAALALFFAGSARYLLPIAAPVAMLAVNRSTRAILWPALAIQLLLGLALAKVNYDHWDAYRTIVARHEKDWANKRVWINGEFGLRYYAESAGAVPLVRGQAVYPGHLVVSSQAGMPTAFTTGGGAPAPVATYTVTSSLPLRLFAVNSPSAYSYAAHGFRAFDISRAPIDTVEILGVAERAPTLPFLPMNAPEAGQQIVSGIDRVEDGRYRWMEKKGVLLLKRPPTAMPVRVEFFLPDQSPAREVTLTLDGKEVARRTYSSRGAFSIESEAVMPAGEAAVLAVEVDQTFSVPGDQRVLGMIIVSAGFR